MNVSALAVVVGVLAGAVMPVSLGARPASPESPVLWPCPPCQPQGGFSNVAGQVACGFVVNITDIGSTTTHCEQYFNSCIPDDDNCMPALGFSIMVPPGSTVQSAHYWGGGNDVDMDLTDRTINIGIYPAGQGEDGGCGMTYSQRYSSMTGLNGAGNIVCVMDLDVACTFCSDG